VEEWRDRHLDQPRLAPKPAVKWKSGGIGRGVAGEENQREECGATIGDRESGGARRF